MQKHSQLRRYDYFNKAIHVFWMREGRGLHGEGRRGLYGYFKVQYLYIKTCTQCERDGMGHAAIPFW